MSDLTNIAVTSAQKNRFTELQKQIHQTTEVPNKITFGMMLDSFEREVEQ